MATLRLRPRTPVARQPARGPSPAAPHDAKADLAVFIGRFQIGPHSGHLQVIREGLTQAQQLCVVIGSASGPRSHYNPFTYDDRRHMIEAALTEDERKRVIFVGMSDYLYANDLWIEAVTRAVTTAARASFGERPIIKLIGHNKSNSGYYLRMFPDWGHIDTANFGGYSAKPMRESYFTRGSEWLEKAGEALPEGVRQWLRHFATTPTYAEVVEEYDFIRGYAAKWGRGPFVSVDGVVVYAGQILLIQRGHRPGRGQWALPGGFLEIDRNETLLDAVAREVREETTVDLGTNDRQVAERRLKRCVHHAEAFDWPFRDPRARIITHAFLFPLDGMVPRKPEVKAATDANWAEWIPLADLHEANIFADHFHIIRRMIGHMPKALA